MFSLLLCAAPLHIAAQTVAVFEFDCDDPNFTEKTAMMSDLLIHELVKSGSVTVVERKRLDKLMQEYAFQASPFVDIKTAKKMGKGLGADCIIVGSVAALGCPLYITARMIDVEKGTVLHSAKMKLNFWSDYEEKLPAFAADCVQKIPMPNIFTGVWTGSVSGEDFDDYYEISFAGKSKCTIKVTTVTEAGTETMQEGNGSFSYASDSVSGGKMFRLNAVFRGAKIQRLRKIAWAYPVSMNADKTEFSINIYPDPKKEDLVRLTLRKTE